MTIQSSTAHSDDDAHHQRTSSTMKNIKKVEEQEETASSCKTETSWKLEKEQFRRIPLEERSCNLLSSKKRKGSPSKESKNNNNNKGSPSPKKKKGDVAADPESTSFPFQRPRLQGQKAGPLKKRLPYQSLAAPTVEAPIPTTLRSSSSACSFRSTTSSAVPLPVPLISTSSRGQDLIMTPMILTPTPNHTMAIRNKMPLPSTPGLDLLANQVLRDDAHCLLSMSSTTKRTPTSHRITPKNKEEEATDNPSQGSLLLASKKNSDAYTTPCPAMSLPNMTSMSCLAPPQYFVPSRTSTSTRVTPQSITTPTTTMPWANPSEYIRQAAVNRLITVPPRDGEQGRPHPASSGRLQHPVASTSTLASPIATGAWHRRRLPFFNPFATGATQASSPFVPSSAPATPAALTQPRVMTSSSLTPPYQHHPPSTLPQPWLHHHPSVWPPQATSMHTETTPVRTPTNNNTTATAEQSPSVRLLANATYTEIPCGCASTRCLKLYCSCFHRGTLCDPKLCHCSGCANTPEHNVIRGDRHNAIQRILARKPNAFVTTVGKTRRGTCHCKHGCLKKYCDCLFMNKPCSAECSCKGCKNTVDMFGKVQASKAVRMLADIVTTDETNPKN